MKKWIIVMVGILALAAILISGCAKAPTPTPTATPTPAPTTTEMPTARPAEELFLIVREPQDEMAVYTSRITVSGTTRADAVVSINGAITDVDSQGNFSSEVNLEAGPNVIEIVASDFYGDEKSDVRAVVYAAALPLTVIEPLNESVVMSQPVMVRGTTNADAAVSVNGNMVPVDASGNFSTEVSPDVGPNFIEVVASDFRGNSSAVTIAVIYSP
jgi:hypothetical protein